MKIELRKRLIKNKETELKIDKKEVTITEQGQITERVVTSKLTF